MHYSSQLDEEFIVVFMTVSHSAQMLLKLEKCIPISHVTLETVPKYANIERPTSSQLYASLSRTVLAPPPQYTAPHTFTSVLTQRKSYSHGTLYLFAVTKVHNSRVF